MIYDAIIVDSRVSYKNVAIDFGLVNLRLDGHIMTLQDLVAYFCPDKARDFQMTSINLEKCGKLNGIFLLDYLTKCGYRCALVGNVLENSAELEACLSRGARAIILSTTWTFGISELKEMTAFIRKYDNSIPIIVGGIFVFNSYLIDQHEGNSDFDTTEPAEHFLFVNKDPSLVTDVDLFIVDRAGYRTLARVIDRVKSGRDFRDLPNTAFWDGEDFRFNPQQPEILDLNEQEISWADLDVALIPEIAPVQVSLGCPYGCKFCSFFYKRRVFTKNLDAVRRELKALLSRPEVRMIRFVDDNMPGKVLRKVCQILIELGNTIPWTTFVRLDALDVTTLRLLVDSKCADVQVGVESGDPRILKNMDKQVNVDKYREVFDRISAFDISVRASFIIGYPGEDERSVANTIDFLNGLSGRGRALIYVGFAPFLLLPLAPIYWEHERAAFGLQGYFWNWKHRTMAFSDVPRVLKEIFLSVSSDVLFAYSGDPVDFGFDRQILYRVKRSREDYQRALISGGERQLEGLRKQLEASVLALCADHQELEGAFGTSCPGTRRA